MTHLLKFFDGAIMSRAVPTTPPRVASPPRTPSKIVDPQPLVWRDILVWRDARSPFLLLLQPSYASILDKICSKLELQDHLSLAGTCHAIRFAYTERVWQSIMTLFIAPPHNWTNPAYTARERIFSNAMTAMTLDPFQAAEAASALYPGVRVVIPGTRVSNKIRTVVYSFHNEAVRWVNEPTTTLTEAKANWKVNDAQLANISYATTPNHHHPQGADIRHYKVAAVRRIALQAHGGQIGHDAHVTKLQSTAQKKAINKAAKVAANVA